MMRVLQALSLGQFLRLGGPTRQVAFLVFRLRRHVGRVDPHRRHGVLALVDVDADTVLLLERSNVLPLLPNERPQEIIRGGSRKSQRDLHFRKAGGGLLKDRHRSGDLGSVLGHLSIRGRHGGEVDLGIGTVGTGGIAVHRPKTRAHLAVVPSAASVHDGVDPIAGECQPRGHFLVRRHNPSEALLRPLQAQGRFGLRRRPGDEQHAGPAHIRHRVRRRARVPEPEGVHAAELHVVLALEHVLDPRRSHEGHGRGGDGDRLEVAVVEELQMLVQGAQRPLHLHEGATNLDGRRG
mmetsp:Transcript_5662/g.22250  ORF Transcript_5662/g.22250 Transcript_5662/m.22250 type:complete len:294 (-) Transcript_5662:3007-3888(-)